VEEGGQDDQLPGDGAADEVEDQPGPSRVSDEDGGGVADAGGLDGGDGEEAGGEREDGGHDAEGAGGGEGLLEEADEEAGRGAEQGEVRQEGDARPRVALAPEHVNVGVAVLVEGGAGEDGEEDRHDEEDAERVVVHRLPREPLGVHGVCAGGSV